jgi:hypothetical protein
MPDGRQDAPTRSPCFRGSLALGERHEGRPHEEKTSPGSVQLHPGDKYLIGCAQHPTGLFQDGADQAGGVRWWAARRVPQGRRAAVTALAAGQRVRPSLRYRGFRCGCVGVKRDPGVAWRGSPLVDQARGTRGQVLPVRVRPCSSRARSHALFASVPRCHSSVLRCHSLIRHPFWGGRRERRSARMLERVWQTCLNAGVRPWAADGT